MPDIIVISDVHASDRWKGMLAARKPGDEAIFLGDYFDRRGYGPFAESQARNFIEICDYALANPPTTLLIGNHDFNYTPWAWGGSEDTREAREIAQALMPRIGMLEMIAIRPLQPRPAIFSHGGLTQTFMRLHGLRGPEEVNRLWRERPEDFEWIPHDPLTGASSNPYGDDPWQSPLWAREKALYEDGARGYDQIVGHTPVPEPETFRTRYGDTILMTCTLDDQPVIIPAA